MTYVILKIRDDGSNKSIVLTIISACVIFFVDFSFLWPKLYVIMHANPNKIAYIITSDFFISHLSQLKRSGHCFGATFQCESIVLPAVILHPSSTRQNDLLCIPAPQSLPINVATPLPQSATPPRSADRRPSGYSISISPSIL
jgi:hypothetical protein